MQKREIGIGHFLIALLLVGLREPIQKETYIISTVSGTASVVSGYSGDGGLASQARLTQPSGLAVNSDGNVYIADTGNHVIRRIDSSGIIRTVAGTGAQGFGGDGGPATQATLLFPEGVAVDSVGNLYIADTQNHRIRKVDGNGRINTIAGNGKPGYSGDGGPAPNAQLSWPWGLVIDSTDTVYFTDSGNNVVRKISPDGVIKKVAGTPGLNTSDRRNLLASPRGLALDASGGLFVADWEHHRVARISPDGNIHVIAGRGTPGRSIAGSGDGGQAIAATLPFPTAVAFDSEGNLFVASDRIRRVDKQGIIDTALGIRQNSIGDPPYWYRPNDDDDPLKIALGTPWALAFDPNGDLYVADSDRNRILRLNAQSRVSITAGIKVLPEETEGGPAELARYSGPSNVAVSASGDVFVTDTQRNRVCRITKVGRLYTVAGKGRLPPTVAIEGYVPPPSFGGDGGPAMMADLDNPTGIAIDNLGNIYFSDSNNQRVRRVNPDGIIETIAGTGGKGFGGDGGPATAAMLANPMGLAVDAMGNLYIADRENNRIREVTSDGNIKTVVGSGLRGDSGEGPALSIKLNFPHGVAVGPTGALYVADTVNHRIRKLDKDGIVRTVAGTGKPEFIGDGGPAVEAGLAVPDAIAR